MKYFIFPVALLLSGIVIFSACNNEKKKSVETPVDTTADKQTIRSLMDTYNNHFVKGEYEAMTPYIYPGIFEYFSKEEMISSMAASMHHDDFDIDIQSVTIDSISPVYIAEGDGKYAWITHKAKALYQFKPDVKEEFLRANCINYTSAFGDANVECNIAEKNFNITIQDISFMIYKDSLQKWYTLGTSSEEDLNRFVPENIRTKMGLQKQSSNK